VTTSVIRVVSIALVAILPTTSYAAEKLTRIVVLARQGSAQVGDVEDAAPAIAERVQRTASYAVDLDVVSSSQLARLELEAPVRGCGPSIGCIAERLSSGAIDLAVVVAFNAGATPPISTIELVDTEKKRVSGTALIEGDRSNPDILRRVDEEAIKLITASGHTIGGRLVVEASPPDARVWIDGAQASSFVLRTGTHVVTAVHDGYKDARLEVVVEPLKDERISLSLEPKGLTDSFWFWGGVGLGAAAIATAATVAAIVLRPAQSVVLCQTAAQPSCARH
jgi:hypothetical protein